MPELPEVETIRRDLTRRILAHKIKEVKVLSPKTVQGSVRGFIKVLQNNSFSHLERIGKLLIFALADKKNYLLIHLKMTGQLIYAVHGKILAGGHSLQTESLSDYVGGELPTKSTRAWLLFAGGSRLFFNDQRRFGYLKIVNSTELAKIKLGYGIEPLTKEFTVTALRKVLAGRKKNIKAVLLDQKLIAGVGNIYADEVLFASHVRPDRPTSSLTAQEVGSLYKNLGLVIKKAIKYRGTTFSDYVDARGRQGNFVKLLKVYGRKGQSCLVCKTAIRKIRVAGRGTHFCPKCQK
jgi:formamidopyrimidine-DNA glycosylase